VRLASLRQRVSVGDVPSELSGRIEFRSRCGRSVTEEASKLRAEIGHLRGEMIERIESVRSELTGRIESVRSELIKWMFVFWVGQIGAIVGILFAFFRK
jgi:hypothetical protein